MWEDSLTTLRAELRHEAVERTRESIRSRWCFYGEKIPLRETVTYLSGGISGRPDHQREFADVAHRLRRGGWPVVSPAEMRQDAAYCRLMARDFVVIACVDSVTVLDEWTASRGSRAEVDMASFLNLPVYSATTGAQIERAGELAREAARFEFAVAV
jgi:hypothetical protein